MHKAFKNLTPAVVELLSMTLSNLVKVDDLSNLNLGEQQVSSLFSLMASGCKIASLNMEEVDLSSVSPQLLSCTSKLRDKIACQCSSTTAGVRFLKALCTP